MEILQALEVSGFAMLVKQSSTPYVAVLAFHTIGLVFLVGVSGATAMRILGVARSMPLEPMQDFFPLMYVGLWVNVITGTVLFCLYPTTYVTDPLFYIKLGSIAIAAVLLRKLRAHVFGAGVSVNAAAESNKAKVLAGGLLLVWMAALMAGRLMAYDVITQLQTTAAAIVFALVAMLFVYLAGRSLGLTQSSG